MADDFGGHDPLTSSTLPHDNPNPTVIHPNPEKVTPSRQSTMRSKGGFDVHASGATTPSSFNRASRHDLNLDDYFVRFYPFPFSQSYIFYLSSSRPKIPSQNGTQISSLHKPTSQYD